jgi:hypothetical protein
VYAQLGTPSDLKELLILERSYHIITRDVERDLLGARLTRFIERVADAARAASAWATLASDAGGPVAARRAIGLG